MIPKILQFHWFFDPLPDWLLANLDEWRALYPDWDLRLYRDIPSDLPEFARELMDAAPTGRLKADIVRYWLLHRDGGIYADLDTRPCRKIGDELLRMRAFQTRINLFGKTPILDVCFLGSEPGHPFWMDLLDGCRRLPPEERQYGWYWSVHVYPDDLEHAPDVDILPTTAIESSTPDELLALRDHNRRPPLAGEFYLKHYHRQSHGLDPDDPPRPAVPPPMICIGPGWRPDHA